MAWLNELPGMGAAEDRAAKALSFPVGASSPLWLAFGAAASAGVAFWLATRWTRQTNLEAVMEAPAKALEAAVAALPDTPVVSEATVETLVAAADPTPVVEIMLEAAEDLRAVAAEVVADIVETPAPASPDAGVIEAVPETVTEAVVEPKVAAPVADDLTRIAGIGPKLAAALAERGVTRFADLAAWGEAELADVDKALSLKGRAVRDAWVAQAQRFAKA